MKRFALPIVLLAVSTACARPTVPMDRGVQSALANPIRLDVAWRYSAGREEVFEFRPQEIAGLDVSDVGRVVVVATSRGQLIGLGADDGIERWIVDEGESLASRPRVADGIAYVGFPDATLRAIDVRTGAELWRASTGGPVASRAVIDGAQVLVMAGDGALYAFERETGAVVWRVERRRPAELTVLGDASPAVDADGVVAGFADGTLLAVDRSGAVTWSADVAGEVDVFPDVSADPVIADGRVFAASFGGGLKAFDRNDGSALWATEAREIIWLAAIDGLLVTVDADGAVRWLDPSSGEVLGELLLDGVPLAADYGPTGMIVVSTSGDGLYFVDAHQPWIHHRFTPGEGVSTAPSLLGSRIFALSDGGFVYGLDVYGQ